MSASNGAPGASAGARKVLHYVDPMHPAYTSDRPGIAPDCGMQLEPVYEDGGPAGGAGVPPRPAGTVTLGTEIRQLQGVRIGTVEEAPGTQAVRLFGRVAPDETRVYTLNAAMEGSIRAMSGLTAGSPVRKGEWLGSFFSADMRTPMQAFITALDASPIATATPAEVGRAACLAAHRTRMDGVHPLGVLVHRRCEQASHHAVLSSGLRVVPEIWLCEVRLLV